MHVEPTERYGRLDLTREDVRAVDCLSLDLRLVTGAPLGTPDETRILAAGTCTLSVLRHADPKCPPIGEIRIWFRGRELRIVGAPTGREGIVEVTPDLLGDAGYRNALRQWLGVAV